MPKLRIGVLYDGWDDGTEDAAEDKARRRKRRRVKPDHEEVYEALKKLGHDPLRPVLDTRPDLPAVLERLLGKVQETGESPKRTGRK